MAINNTTIVYGRLPSRAVKNDASSKRDKIYGFGFPMGSQPNKGFFHRESNIVLTKNNLRQLLLTERGERILLPNYGVSLRKYLFEPLDEITFSSIKREILETLHRYAQNVDVLRLRVTPLDDFGIEGFQALEIKLLLKMKEIEEATFEVKVKLI